MPGRIISIIKAIIYKIGLGLALYGKQEGELNKDNEQAEDLADDIPEGNEGQE